jgi:hypothetical protein
MILGLPGRNKQPGCPGPEVARVNDGEIRVMVQEIAVHNKKELSPEEFEDLVHLIGHFWDDVEKEADKVSQADKETVIAYFNGMLSCLSGAFMHKYRMDTFHAHTRAGDEILSTALNLIYEKGLMRDFIVRFESIPLRDGVYKEYLNEKTHLKEQLLKASPKE